MSRRVVWINGAFGVGKSTTAIHFLAEHPGWRYFDPEQVGYMLRALLGDRGEADFRDLPAWRRLVPIAAGEIADRTHENLLAVQTVTNEAHWEELSSGLDAAGLSLVHIVLHCDPDVLRARIEADTVDLGARQWRLDHVAEFVRAGSWLTHAADSVIDTSVLTAEEVAAVLGSVTEVR